MGRGRESPGPMVMGKDSTSGTRNSGEEETTPLTESVHFPLLVTIKGLSTNEPTQMLPKFPVSAMIRLAMGGGATPETDINCGDAGSSLMIVIVPNLEPK